MDSKEKLEEITSEIREIEINEIKKRKLSKVLIISIVSILIIISLVVGSVYIFTGEFPEDEISMVTNTLLPTTFNTGINNAIINQVRTIINSYKSNPKVNDLQVSLDNGLKISYLNYDITYRPIFILNDDSQLSWSEIPDNVQKDLWKTQVAPNKYKYGVDFTNITTAQKDLLKFVALKRVNATKTVTICDSYDEGMCNQSHVEVQQMTLQDIQGKIRIEGSDLIIGNKVLLSHDDLLATYNLPVVNRSVIVIGGLDNSWEVCDEWDLFNCTSSHTEYNWKDNGDGTWNISFDPTITISEEEILTTSLLKNVTAETGDSNFTHLTINNLTAPYDDLILYIPFDGDVNDTINFTVYDWSSFGNDGNSFNKSIVNSTGCRSGFGNCAKFFDDTDLINVSYSDSLALDGLTGSYTVSVWIKGYPADGGIRVIDIWDPAGYPFSWAATSNSGNLTLAIYDGSNVPFAMVNNSLDGSWHHIVQVVDNVGDDIEGYLDGVLFDNVTNTVTNTTLTTEDIYIGNSFAENRGFNGSIDEVMIFNTSLTAQQISDIYNNQSARFKTQGTQRVRAINITNSTTWDNGIFNRVNLSTDFQRNLNSNMSARVGQMNFSVDPDGLVLYMPFEWGSAVDISGKDNDGTIVNAIFNETGGLNETGGFEFDGDSDYINIGNDTSLNNLPKSDFSISAWIYDKWIGGADLGTIFSGWNTGTNGWIFRTYTNSSGSRFLIFDVEYGTTNAKYWSANGTIISNRWHHTVAVWNSTSNVSTLYIDGTEPSYQFQIQGVGTYQVDTDNNKYMGQLYSGGSHYFNGTLDNIIIFNRTLSATEISNLYQNQSQEKNQAYYTPYQNLTASKQNTTFTISTEADFIFPDFKFLASSTSFYSPILSGDVGLSLFSDVAPDNPPVSILSLPLDNNISTISDTTKLVNFQCNATDDINLQNVTWQLYNKTSGISIAINTTDWTGTSNSTTFTYNFTGFDDYLWNCLVFDNASQSDWGVNRTITIQEAGRFIQKWKNRITQVFVSTINNFGDLFVREINATGISSDGANKSVCIKTDGNLGTCAGTITAGVCATCT